MIIRGLDEDGDWVLGIGINAYKTLNDAVAQNVQTKILEWKNDCFSNNLAGIDWLNRIGFNDLARLRSDIYVLILQSENVVGVNELSVSLNNRTVIINYDIQTVYTQSVINSVENTI